MSEPLLQNLGELNDAQVERKLLISHAITRLGTQGWLFIAPLVLLRFTPGSISGPAIWGLVTMLASAFLSGPVGSWADRTDRSFVVIVGVLTQFVAVLGSTGVILMVLANGEVDTQKGALAIGLFTALSVVEKLGTVLSDVSVKREWTPQLFDKANQTRVNTRMSQIDLSTEVIGPFIAGMLITAGDQQAVKNVLPQFLSSTDFGFVATGALNALSFWPQLALLRSIYRSHNMYLKPTVAKVEEAQTKEDTSNEGSAWGIWWRHAGGLAWLSSSYALLYLTVLSPHGALLTGYLITENVPAYQLSLVRGAGALWGVFGVTFQPGAVRCMGDRKADGFGVCWLAGWMVVAMIAFNAAGATRGDGLTIPLLIFVSAVCLGRPGLYSFELGILNKEQDLVDKRHRSAIGAVDTALTSLGTVVMYLAGLVWNRTEQFGLLVTGSAFFVCLGAVTYLLWTCLYKFTRHRHDNTHEHGHGHSGQGHAHGPAQEHQHHVHTLDMEEALEDGWHAHLTYDPSVCCVQ